MADPVRLDRGTARRIGRATLRVEALTQGVTHGPRNPRRPRRDGRRITQDNAVAIVFGSVPAHSFEHDGDPVSVTGTPGQPAAATNVVFGPGYLTHGDPYTEIVGALLLVPDSIGDVSEPRTADPLHKYVPLVEDAGSGVCGAWRDVKNLTRTGLNAGTIGLPCTGYIETIDGDEVFVATSIMDMSGLPGFVKSSPQIPFKAADALDFELGGEACA